MVIKQSSRNFAKGIFLFFVMGHLCSCNTSEVESPAEIAAVDLLDQSYGASSSQTMDIYLPSGRSKEETPILVYIHGGAWVNGSKEEFLNYRNYMSAALPSYAFISIDYSLFDLNTGVNKFPSQENDVIEAIKFIVGKTAEWNISKKILLAGASAGGHLALLHAYKHEDIGDIQAVIAFFPPTDLTTLYNFNFITQMGLTGLLTGTPASNPEAYEMSSPINYVSSQSVPTIIFHGTADNVVPVSQSESLAEALSAAGVSYKLTIVPNEGHGFQSSTYQSLFGQVADFLNEQIP